MADPLRLQVLKAMTTALEEITYRTTPLTGKVFRGRLRYSDNNPLPMLSILEPPVAPDVLISQLDNRAEVGEWRLLIQGFLRNDPKNPGDPSYELLALVKQRLMVERRRKGGDGFNNVLGFGDQIDGFEIGKGVCRPPDEISDQAYFWLPISINLVEDVLNPFA